MLRPIRQMHVPYCLHIIILADTRMRMRLGTTVNFGRLHDPVLSVSDYYIRHNLYD
jgi:hypothetical protein